MRAAKVMAGKKIAFTEPLDFLLHLLVFKITRLNVFTKVLKVRPDIVFNHRHIGFAYANSGEYVQVLKHFEIYLDCVPNAEDRIQIVEMMEKLGKELEKR